MTDQNITNPPLQDNQAPVETLPAEAIAPIAQPPADKLPEINSVEPPVGQI